MIFGDEPRRMNEITDRWGRSTHTLVPDTWAMMQNGNLYAFGLNNPVMFVDPTGRFVITTTTLVILGGAAVLGAGGGFLGNRAANQRGATGWDRAGWIAGGVAGAAGGYVLAPYVIGATGVGAISVSTAGVSTIAASGTAVSPAMQELFNRTSSHIFSRAHIQGGIMNLGNSQVEIFNKITTVANNASGKWAAGSNEIRTVINGIETTIRFYVKDNKIINIDAFVGYSERVIGNLIN